MLVFGHRGAAGYVAENTAESLRYAIALGVDGLEFDVRACQDDVPVVIHDATLERTTDGVGEVSLYTHRELLAWNANCLQGRFPSSIPMKIPTLATILAEFGPRTTLNIEIKEDRVAQEVVRSVEEYVADEKRKYDRLLVSSFLTPSLLIVRQLQPHLPLGLLLQGHPDRSAWKMAESLDAQSINIDLASLRVCDVQEAHRRGRRVMVYTVNNPDDAKRLKDWNVDAVFSDFPDRILAIR